MCNGIGKTLTAGVCCGDAQRLLQPKAEKHGRPRGHAIPLFDRCRAYSRNCMLQFFERYMWQGFAKRSFFCGTDGRSERGARPDGQTHSSPRRSEKSSQGDVDPLCGQSRFRAQSARGQLAKDFGAKTCPGVYCGDSGPCFARRFRDRSSRPGRCPRLRFRGRSSHRSAGRSHRRGIARCVGRNGSTAHYRSADPNRRRLKRGKGTGGISGRII